MVEGRFGGDVHDGAAPLPQHRGNRGARQRIPRAKIQVQHLLEDLRFRFPQFEAARIPSNGVYHCIQAAVLEKNFLDEPGHGRFIGNVDFVTLQPDRVCRHRVLERFPFRLKTDRRLL